jgi:putative NADH-flavin reductase
MRISVFGASGGIGTEVVRQSLAAGDEVIAVIRTAASLAVEPSDRLTVMRAQVTDPSAIAPAVKATDSVVSALGPRRRDGAGICSQGTDSVLTAMRAVGTRRLVVVSAGGAFIDEGDGFFSRTIIKPLIVQRLFRDGFVDLRVMEEEVRASGLNWTIVRPTRLLSRAHTGRYRTAVDRNVRGGYQISRADVADAIRRALKDPTTIGHTIGVAY